MIMKNLKIAAALLVSAAMFAGCNLLETVGSAPEVSLTALSEFDAQGEAVVQVVLSTYALEEVSVVLAASGDAAAAVTMEKAVKIAVGSKTQNVTVKLDQDKVTADSVLKISITSATGATVGSAKEVSLAVTATAKPEDPATLTIAADDEFAEDATAKLTLKLNKALAEDVSVELQVLSSEDFLAIPAEALAFENPVVIKAGQTTAEVKVTLDASALPTGDSYAYIAIKGFQGNANLGQNKEVLIAFVKQIVAKVRNDWSIVYNGYQEAEGYDAVGINVSSENDTYYIAVYGAGAVAESFDSVTEYLQWYENSNVAPYLDTEDAETVYAGNMTARYQRLNPDSYEVFIIGCNEQGHVTGDYATLTFTVEPTSEMVAAVESFLGEWIVNHYTWNIESAGGVYVTINGIEGEDDLPVEAFVNWDANLEIVNQPYIKETETEVIGFYGLAGGSLWSSSGFTIAEIVLNEDGESATINPVTSPNGSAFESLAYLLYDVAAEKYYLYSDQIAIPTTMQRPAEAVEETTPVVTATYEDFLGTWMYGDYEILIETVEGEEGYYYISGFPSQSSYSKPVASFADGALHLTEQSLGTWSHNTYGQCVDLLNAVFSYGDKEYRAYGWNTADPSEIFKAELHESGNLTFTPGEVTLEFNDGTTQNAPIVGLVYAWMIIEEGSENYGRGNWSNTMYLNASVAAVPATAPAAAPAAVKKAPRKDFGRTVETIVPNKMAKYTAKERVIR